MALLLTKYHKQCFLIIAKLNTEDLKAYCAQTIKYLEYCSYYSENTASVENLHPSSRAILNFLLECSKQDLQNDEFGECAIVLGFDEEKTNILKKLYKHSSNTLRSALCYKGPNLERYVDLHWRFEAQVRSRYLNEQRVPIITMKLQLSQNTGSLNKNIVNKIEENVVTFQIGQTHKKEILMQTDISSLLKIINILENALREGKSQRVHSIVHNLEKSV